MPEILHHSSDDQLALAICLGAVAASGLIMHFSLHVGRLTGLVPVRHALHPREFRLREAPADHSTMPTAAVARERAA